MAAPILPVSGVTLPEAIRPAGQAASGGGFQEVFSSAVKSVEAFGQNASASVERFLSGEGEELHNTVLATQQAELAFELFMQARNKVVSAYQEIMRMQM
ncbi:MAG TPA: flagellar hook-basal body complex protein FliE [Verrucomicrobiae bacterium]|nr:flagellar hook-basal body complex protein FliE [Candidatus Acidoferrales bacterium]HXK07118.1 flagellar hook-basal body complex protein FliE [Verrucomicrobiae bacterium]